MTTGDVICPVCSAVNRSLNLEETDGWMECISCGAVVQVIHLEENYHSVYAPDQSVPSAVSVLRKSTVLPWALSK